MKLSFSLPSKSKPKVTATAEGNNAADDGASKEFVTEFDPSKTLADSTPKFVIPPIENTWRPHKKMKNLDLPLQSGNTGSGLEFEPEVPLSGTERPDNISYGLNLREKVKGDDDSVGGGDASEDRKLSAGEQLMLQKLRRDLKSLADDPTLEDFESVPVEGYGAALMAGYGWKPGKGIGKNAKEDVEIKEYKKWTAKEGLGFDPDRSKVVDVKAKVKESVKLVRDVNGRDVFFVGKEVRIVGGRDIGLKGKIVEKLGSDLFAIKISGSEEEVKVGVNEVADLGSKEEEKCLKKLKELQLNDKEKDKKVSKRGRGAERGSQTEVRVSEKQDRSQTREKKSKPSWLRSHIKVRIVSKDLKGGRLYLKKGKVVDVVGPTTCDITMDETQELVQGVDQELLETALPRRGGPVLVLLGKHKGVYGNLVEKDLDKETGVVRDLDNHKMLDVRLDQVAEYMGDMDDIEY
ncbi:PREDICTED: protein MOS2 [Camelina sativa]|uniref:Protein MOS2 n=1 Tax=Camelina sativa TaxID=90675 RepID=A0ABM0YEW9_CAMSA|nr:PREDICTED: protein MOS2 [Camelina sativa]